MSNRLTYAEATNAVESAIAAIQLDDCITQELEDLHADCLALVDEFESKRKQLAPSVPDTLVPQSEMRDKVISRLDHYMQEHNIMTITEYREPKDILDADGATAKTVEGDVTELLVTLNRKPEPTATAKVAAERNCNTCHHTGHAHLYPCCGCGTNTGIPVDGNYYSEWQAMEGGAA